MINHGKNKNVLAGNFQKTIRFAAGLFDRVDQVGIIREFLFCSLKTGWVNAHPAHPATPLCWLAGGSKGHS